MNYCLPATSAKGSSAPNTSPELAVMGTFALHKLHQVFAVIFLPVKDHLQTEISADLQIHSTLSHSSPELTKICLVERLCSDRTFLLNRSTPYVHSMRSATFTH